MIEMEDRNGIRKKKTESFFTYLKLEKNLRIRVSKNDNEKKRVTRTLPVPPV